MPQTVRLHEASFRGSTHTWHRNSICESGLKGTESCWVVPSSAVFCKVRPVSLILLAADITASLEDVTW